MTYKIICTDGFSNAGVDELKRSSLFDVVVEKTLSHEELLEKIPAFDGLVVRSASKVGMDIIEAGVNLKIIARAGVGTDNIDVEAATKKGILVVNTPSGNTTSTAELAFAMLLSLARHIPQAASSMSEGVWEKKKFAGTELAGKTLGVIGLGRIGREVARRAKAFSMNVIAFDPGVAEEQFKVLGVSKAVLGDILKAADYITIHTPLTPETENLITMRELAAMKKTACVINCARGGIVNENDLARALKEGRIAGAALDVYTKEPFDKPIFRGLPNMICTPHLGASTAEAQDAVSIEAARAITEFFSHGAGFSAVNLKANADQLEKYSSHLKLAEKMGSLLAQIGGGEAGRVGLLSKSAMPNIVTLAAITGVLSLKHEKRATLVNAALVAKELGISIFENISDDTQVFADAFGVVVESGNLRRETWGAVFGDGTFRIVMLDGYRVEIEPAGIVLLIHNSDQPGVIGSVCSILGEMGVNIAEMQNVRKSKGSDALTVIRIDESLEAKELERIRKVKGVASAAVVCL